MINKLTSIEIDNYKCFKKTSLSIKDTCVLIGENNAGKSTVVECLKLIAFAIEKFKKGRFEKECPLWVCEELKHKAVCLKVKDLLIDINSSAHNFNKKNSTISAFFENNIKLVIITNSEDVYALLYQNNENINKKAQVINLNLPEIFVMPHFNLLRELEKPLIDNNRIESDRFNYRSSLHFRNELHYYESKIPKLNDLLFNTWGHLNIKIDYEYGYEHIYLMVRDGDFVNEVKNYGSGIQMWLQILWFLCKIPDKDVIVVLDEPDVYIHADLQRKLYHLAISLSNQTIIATHSIEIINETRCNNLLLVNKNDRHLKYCFDKTSLNEFTKTMGISQNLTLTKLQRHNKCLFIEGEDVEILDFLYKVVTNKTNSINDFATVKLNGKSKYSEMFGAAKLFKDDSSGAFKIFCLLDKDYNEDYNKKITKEAEENGIRLYILKKVEIENYLIIPHIFASLLKQDIDTINNQILHFCNELKDSTFDRILSEKYLEYNKLKKSNDLSIISKESREFISNNWNTLENILNIVPGKELKKKLYDWAKTQFNISLNDKKVCELITKTDIPNELYEFLQELAK